MSKQIAADIPSYNALQLGDYKDICTTLEQLFNTNLPKSESKIYHGNPVWFIDGNPIVGYSKLKDSVCMLFWSGQSFDEPGLKPEGSFKAAEKRYTSMSEIDTNEIRRWLSKAITIQWDYKNIVKRRGVLERLI